METVGEFSSAGGRTESGQAGDRSGVEIRGMRRPTRIRPRVPLLLTGGGLLGDYFDPGGRSSPGAHAAPDATVAVLRGAGPGPSRVPTRHARRLRPLPKPKPRSPARGGERLRGRCEVF